MKSLNELFRLIILANEDSNDINVALRFSNAGGNSGYSFGVSQMDVSHSGNAVTCLKECGFTDDEISALQAKTVDRHQFTSRLQASAGIIAKWDETQLSQCLDKALNFVTGHGVPVESPGGILAGADYCNQYGSEGNGAVVYYKALGRPVTAEDVLAFKLDHTAYGKAQPGDCKRRYDNIVAILAKEGM